MRILIDSGSYHCGNVGDVAMLQTAVERLRGLWPQASISVVTNAPAALASYCPGVQPVPLAGRIAFVTDRFFGRANRLLPRRVSDTLAVTEERMRRQWPAVMASVIGSKRALALRRDHAAPSTYVDALKRADLVLVSGAGVFTDAFADNAMGVLATLGYATEWNIPAAALGQGFGPVCHDGLRLRMARVLPRLDLIAVREERESVRLLESVGVSRHRIVVTGDDATEMANRTAPAEIGDAIGINIRVASYAGVNGSIVDRIGPVLPAAARRLRARLLPVPMAFHSDCSDSAAIEQLMAGEACEAAPSIELEQPVNVISRVSRCRIIVTGSYHGAVFALAQGIPVVAIAATPYYVNKFSGLAHLFNGGCEIVMIGAPDARVVLERAIDRAWTSAPWWREPLLRAARAQIERGKAAYRRLGTIVGAGCAGRASRVAAPRAPALPRDL
jgi:polysaccharide pyruvyl transferase WcaK-like protein